LNILGRNALGGNFWARTNGSGFSQNVTACDPDGISGICLNNYTFDSSNIDFLPLTLLNDSTFPTISWNSLQNTTYYYNTSTGYVSVFINITSSDSYLNRTWFYNGTNFSYSGPTTVILGSGNQTLIAYANDSANNVNWTSVQIKLDLNVLGGGGGGGGGGTQLSTSYVCNKS
jgi:hypothetical protein